MGCIIELVNPQTGEPVDVPSHNQGYVHPAEPINDGEDMAIVPQTQAKMVIPTQYLHKYQQHLTRRDGLLSLDNKWSAENKYVLREGIESLGVDEIRDVHNVTDGNAGFILSVMLDWATQNPNALWNIMVEDEPMIEMVDG